ncbi:MAG: DUF2130 domain-containing protein [Mycoplasmoidaceae bacterium]
MSKKIKIEIKNLNKNEFFLDEDAKKGDYFCLEDIGAFSIDYIKEQFNEKIDKIANDRFIEKLYIEKKNWENEFKASEEYLKLIKESSYLKEKIESIEETNKEKEKNIINEFKTSEEYLKLIKESSYLKEKIESIEESNKEKEKNFYENKDKDIQLLKNQFTTENLQKISDLNAEINSLKEKLEKRNNKNIKIIGEGLEKWILEEFDKYFSINDKVDLKKITKSTNPNDSTMADFEFIVTGENKEILGSAVIEAKTESETGKTKNEKHYEKLERQRKKLNYEYSILVSELEPENTFLIKKVTDYNNMFVIRPSYLMTFLSLIEYISKEKQGIKKLELDFKNKQEIQDEFEKMKNEILENSIKNINKKCEEIHNEIIKIESSSKKIKSAIETVIETHMITIKNKIEKFKIESILKKIEKIN